MNHHRLLKYQEMRRMYITFWPSLPSWTIYRNSASDGLVRKTARGQVCSDHRPQSETHALLVLCALQLPTSPLHRKSKLLRCFNKVFPQCCGCIGPSNWCYGIDSSSGVTPQTFIISQTTWLFNLFANWPSTDLHTYGVRACIASSKIRLVPFKILNRKSIFEKEFCKKITFVIHIKLKYWWSSILSLS